MRFATFHWKVFKSFGIYRKLVEQCTLREFAATIYVSRLQNTAASLKYAVIATEGIQFTASFEINNCSKVLTCFKRTKGSRLCRHQCFKQKRKNVLCLQARRFVAPLCYVSPTSLIKILLLGVLIFDGIQSHTLTATNLTFAQHFENEFPAATTRMFLAAMAYVCMAGCASRRQPSQPTALYQTLRSQIVSQHFWVIFYRLRFWGKLASKFGL